MIALGDNVCVDLYHTVHKRVDESFHLLNGEEETPSLAIYLRIANRIEGRILLRVGALIRERVIEVIES